MWQPVDGYKVSPVLVPALILILINGKKLLVLSGTTWQTSEFPLLDTIEFVSDLQKTKNMSKIDNGKSTSII